MASALGVIALLALAGAVLHIAWHLVLAILIWVPSAAGGISIGWYVAIWASNTTLGMGVAILAATLIRAIVARVLAWLWARTFGWMLVR